MLNRNKFYLGGIVLPPYFAQLRSLGLKVTPKRVAMLEILAAEKKYLSPDDVWQKMKQRFAQVGLPTVYRNLEELARGGMISTILHPSRQLFYYLCTNTEHHHHFVCITCRRVDDIDFCALYALQNEAPPAIKGKVLTHTFQVSGICESCMRKESVHAGTA
jgi:Fe2+ or Zn2+ uptake regulation protein